MPNKIIQNQAAATGVLLNHNDQIYVPFDFLPVGEFEFPIAAINPFEEMVDLLYYFTANNNMLIKDSVKFDTLTVNKVLNFSILEGSESRNTGVVFQLKSGSIVNLILPSGPHSSKVISETESKFKNVAEQINFEIDLVEKGEETEFYSLQTQPSGPTSAFVINENKVESIIHDRYFRGILSLTEAEKQLDFVINNKMFAPDGSRGFRKWKISFYRKLLRVTYRRLAKNSRSKQYLIKLYRNYINNDIISKNIQDT